MKKNEIIEKVIDGLMAQREDLLIAIRGINFNETNSDKKQILLETQISNIDMQLDRRVTECIVEINPE